MTDESQEAAPEEEGPRYTMMNGREHEVCSGCDSVVGHGCPQSEPCECEED